MSSDTEAIEGILLGVLRVKRSTSRCLLAIYREPFMLAQEADAK